MSGKHLASLDGLRGLAILLVVFYHIFPHRDTGLLGFLSSASWCGVDLFFVLSGFLITGILFDAQGAPAYFRNFYMRRTLRLFPVYIVFISIVLLLPHQPTGHAWWLTALYVCYAANIVLFFIPSFQVGLPLVVNHIWSLSVEEQFYLLWPWIVTRLKTRRRIFIACICGSIAALALRLFIATLHLTNLLFVYYELPTRADALLLGAAAAMLYRTPGFLAKHLTIVRITAVLAPLIYFTMALHAHTFFFAAKPINTWGYTLLAVTATSVLLLAVHPGSWTGHFFANPFLRFYGRYSYGLYLFHQAPAQYDILYLEPIFTRHIHPLWLAAILHFLVVLALATALAVLSFRFIEQPFLNLKRKFPERPRPQLDQLAHPSRVS